MGNKNGLDAKNKIYIGIFLSVFLALICPFLVNETYSLWDASDALSYYGTLIGAAATIIAVTWTIKNTKESAQEDRKSTENINFRNLIVDAAFDFIEAVNYQLTSTEIMKIVLIMNKKLDFKDIELIRENLMFIIIDSNMKFAKYQMFCNKSNAYIFPEIQKYINNYYKDVEKFEEILIEIR